MNYAIKKTECDANKILAEYDLKYAHFGQIQGPKATLMESSHRKLSTIEFSESAKWKENLNWNHEQKMIHKLLWFISYATSNIWTRKICVLALRHWKTPLCLQTL